MNRARIFLKAYKATASVTKAAAAAKIDRSIHYRRLKVDTAYSKAFADAQEEAIQTLEDEAVRRASEGVLKPVFFQGAPCGAVREYSDSLLQFLLRGAKPAKYRERHQHSGSLDLNVTRFKGSMETLLALYRSLTEAPDDEDTAG